MPGRTRSSSPKLVVVASTWNRRRKARWLTRYIAEHSIRSVLIVGPGGGGQAYENLVESAIADAVADVVACGIHAPRVSRFPMVMGDGRSLPFRDRSFDLVFSNAVVEHVGDEDDQRRFLREHARVGTHWVATTPNRWFPIESHTGVVLRHWRARWRAERASLFSRLLSRGEFRRIAPGRARLRGTPLAPTFMLVGSAQPDRPQPAT